MQDTLPEGIGPFRKVRNQATIRPCAPAKSSKIAFGSKRSLDRAEWEPSIAARDLMSDQTVALKLMNADHWSVAHQFTREAMILSDRQHPGIVRYVRSGATASGVPVFIRLTHAEALHAAERTPPREEGFAPRTIS